MTFDPNFTPLALAADVTGWTSLANSTGLVWADFKMDQANAKLTAWNATKPTAQSEWNAVAAAEHAHQVLAITEYETAMTAVIAADRTLASELQTAVNTRQASISTATNADVANGTTTLAQVVHSANVAYATAVGAAQVANETANANSLRDYKQAVSTSAAALEPLAQAATNTITELEQSHYTTAVTDTSFAGQSPFHQQEAEIAAATQIQQQDTHAAETTHQTETTAAQTGYETTVNNETASLSGLLAQTEADGTTSEAQQTEVDGENTATTAMPDEFEDAPNQDEYGPRPSSPNEQQELQFVNPYEFSIPQLRAQQYKYFNFFDESNLTPGANAFSPEALIGDVGSSRIGVIPQMVFTHSDEDGETVIIVVLSDEGYRIENTATAPDPKSTRTREEIINEWLEMYPLRTESDLIREVRDILENGHPVDTDGFEPVPPNSHAQEYIDAYPPINGGKAKEPEIGFVNGLGTSGKGAVNARSARTLGVLGQDR